MEPYIPGSNRAEAERWVSIAEKLLSSRDLVGSKTFAIRAKESEPRLESAEQILAVVDTLIAGEKRINNQHDWYSILQLARYTRDPELIATQYRRFAIFLNPHRNRLPFAEQAMRLVIEAWSVLSNPSKKFLYDNELIQSSKLGPSPATISRSQEYHEPLHHPQPPPPPPQPQPRPQPQPQQQPQPQPQPQHIIPEKQPNHQQNPPNPGNPSANNRNSNVGEDVEIPINQNKTFWTACPYCYNMYEYPGVYEECTFRCQNCQRAFHGAKIPGPPPIAEGKEAYFSCWSFFPMGVSQSNLEKNNGGVTNWTPFSPLFSCGGIPAVGGNVNTGPPKSVSAMKSVSITKSTAPRVYIDDEDDDDEIFVGVSDSSGGSSDEDWRKSGNAKKKAKIVKKKGSGGRRGRRPKGDRAKNARAEEGPGRVAGAPKVTIAETSKNIALKRKAQKDWGRLDLNVELRNEADDAPPGMTGVHAATNGAEVAAGIEEGIGFFEGLDEFLNSLPILNVVGGDDKVKAA